MIRRLIILLLIVGCEETTAPIPTHGCLDSQATNYDATASIDNNSCTYIDSCGVIDIDITNDCVKDCADEWGGDAVIDGCGVCGGEGSAFDANFETTWELYYGQFHPISWTSSENIRWVQASLELLRSFILYGGKRVVMAGSCAEYDWNYGDCSEYLTPLKPATLYGTCKHSLQDILSMYTKQAGISSAWGRIFFLYGPHEHHSRLVSHVISSLLQNKEAVCSSGTQIRDFMYVEDVASAFVSLLDSSVEGPVNICSGQPISVKEVVTLIGKKIGLPGLIKFGTHLATNEPPLLIGDNGRLFDEVKWKQPTDISKGIDKSIGWWRKQFA